MKRLFVYLFALLVSFVAVAQTKSAATTTGSRTTTATTATTAKSAKPVPTSRNVSDTPEIQPTSARPQYVVFQVTPKSAMVVIGEKKLQTDGDGIAIFTLEKGTYNYTVLAKEYNYETGTIEVNDNKIVKSVRLRPTFGWLSVPDLDVLRGADVYVDGTHLGEAPIKNWKLSGGTHRVRIVKELYKPFENDVVIRGGEIFNCAPTLVADYSYVTLNAGRDCSIYVDRQLVGKDSWSGKLATGTYVFEVRKENHRSTSVTKTISATPATQTYYLPRPQPIVGTLNVMSSPAMADVYVDGKHVGQTPLMVDVIIGEHKVKVQKGSLGVAPQTVTISEGKTTDLNLTLTEHKLSEYIETAKGLNIKMIPVEGGTFQMGATSEQGSDYKSDERPVHSVTLDSYYIAETEVTQAQWYAIMGTTIYQQCDKADSSSMYGVGDNNPMYYVSWEEANEFCKRLSELTGKTYTLPTEAQWEYAARGGNKSKGYKYSGSNTIDDVAWYNSNSSGANSVKQKQPNELGLYDMSGNVWEWCSDWKDEYSSSSQTNPTGPSSGSSRVLRGGSWFNYARLCRVSNRDSNNPSLRGSNVGFRLVCLP